MNTRQMHTLCRESLSLPAVLLIFGGACSAQSVPAGIVRHVSPAPLPGIPASRQFRTINTAAQTVRPGDTVVIHAGVYRESVTITTSGTADRPIRFEAAPAASVVVTGADRLTVAKEPGKDSIFSAKWPHSFLDDKPGYAYPEGDANLLIGRCEQVFVRDYPLHQVLRRDQLGRGTFFADLGAKRLYLRSADDADLSSAEVSVTASARPVLWNCTGAYVTVHGLRFRFAANAAQQGAAQFSGQSDTVEDCVFEDTNALSAAFLAPDQVVRRCTFRNNGQMGFGAVRANRLLMTDCVVQNNNTKGFDRGFEAGGGKTVLTRGAVFDRCRVLDNRGVGLWFDIGNEACTVSHCLLSGNEDAGLFYEISYGLHASDNVAAGNGLAETPGAWGGQAGISLSSSPGCVVERNLLAGNREGFALREQERTTPRIGTPEGGPEVPVWNHDEIIRNNVLADNRDAAVWGWFDGDDERQWPRALQQNKHKPGDLSLETLKLTFQSNLYTASDGQDLFHWGTDWRRHRYYSDLPTLSKELGLEQNSAVLPLLFADPAALDYRVPAGSPALERGCYPLGSVPGVLLGVKGGH